MIKNMINILNIKIPTYYLKKILLSISRTIIYRYLDSHSYAT